MSLRVKVELLIFVLLMLVVGLGYGIERYIVLAHFNPQEEDFAVVQWALLAQVGIGLIVLVTLIVLFRRNIMRPLTQLTDHMTRMRNTNNMSARLGLARTDEIGTLAHEFDRMVEQLEEEDKRQRIAEEALRSSEERYALAVRGANDGLWDWNLVTNEIHFTSRWKSMLGYDDEEVGNVPEEWLNRIYPEDRAFVQAGLDAHLRGQTSHFESEHRILHKDETYLWVLCRGLAVRDADGVAKRMAGSQTDITPRKIVEEQLSHQALHDALTTLPNRALFIDRLGQALKHARRHKDTIFAVLFLDLDRFKVINDSLGHVIGDVLLTSFADRLKSSLREADTVARSGGTVARFGGDEFVILLDNMRELADATLVAGRILEVLQTPFHIEGQEIYTSASIGIAWTATGHESEEELLRNADTAMYRAKARGKACYEVFDADMYSMAMQRLQLENDLRHAITREEFVIYYQPIVSLATDRVDAFEALVRWQHPERGLVSPWEFIPLAEETGMVVAIGRYVLREACRQTRIWQCTVPGAAELSISVNLSVKDFTQPDLFESIQGALTDSGLAPQHLKLEITESAILESVEFVVATLKKLRSLNIQLSIDDFGTGYSSLSYLHRFRTNNLKIDRAFVRDMHASAESMQIIKTITLLAQALGMAIIAEGIEDKEQLASLRALHVEYGQGFLFAKPLPAEEAMLMIGPSAVPA